MSSGGTIGTEDIPSSHLEAQATTSGTENGGNVSAGDSSVSRRSFAHSVASSGDAHSALSHSFEWPEIDGISAGRAAALGALCRIICSKTSKESISDSHLAQFYKVLYEALLEKDRLMLCALIFYGNGIFRLALKGVEILLPQLHPSIDEVQMRRSCLHALSTVISWPTTFGDVPIGG
ncbi:unnamed protein product [Gongylonema pulchrum]|uniref:RICTOR_N domain-containing protein n=1 Tax=Gongylonema pulchrum TaxID=637853 RepID=A0A183E111_9BILA|nr:unnamed protein product [Gongylonema pulchrum]